MPSTSTQPRTASSREDEEALLAGLHDGDEQAFAELMDTHNSALLRLAMSYVPSRAVAEEVVQETWLGVLAGLDGFEGRSSIKTWIFRILTNIAKTRGMRERRSLPFSSLAHADELEGFAVDPDRFLPPDHHRYPGHWAVAPARWEGPEDGLLARETREVIVDAIELLLPAQRAVITLRDVEGWPAHEVCDALHLTDGNQRVLLHRARSKVRAALERHFDAAGV